MKLACVEAVCLTCGKPFFKRDRPYRGRNNGRLRSSNAITCSHECSIIYTRTMNNVRTIAKYYDNKH
jgi:hypothetical protein